MAAENAVARTVTRVLPGGTEERQTLAPGEGLLQVRAPSGSLALRRVDPDAPVRLIVTLDATPVLAALRHGADPLAAGRRQASFLTQLEGLRATLPPAEREQVVVGRQFDRLIDGVAIRVPRELQPKIAALPHVTGVFPDDTVRADLDQSVPLIRADQVWSVYGATGVGVRVGIVDTGIDYSHPALGGGFGPGHRVEAGWDFANNDADPFDDHGHGTHVAGIVGASMTGLKGVAPGVTFHAYKVLNAGGYGFFSDVIAGVERCADPDQNPLTHDALDVLNMSLGGGGTADDPLSQAVDAATAEGVVCVVAAGNSGGNFTIGSPGTARTAVTVGATDKNDVLAYFTSRGPSPVTLGVKPDLVAPGVDIRSSWPGGETKLLSGTSMATPHVAGVAALLKQIHPTWTPARIKAAMTETAVELDRTVWDRGSGRIDALAAAGPEFLVTPSSLSYGLDDLDQTVWGRTDTLGVVNVSASSRTIAFSMTDLLPAGVSFVFTPPSVTLAPGESSSVVLRFSVDNRIVGFPHDLPYGFSGQVVASSAGLSRRIPFGFLKCGQVSVTSDLPGYFFLIHDRAGLGTVVFDAQYGGTALVPPGTYDVMVQDFNWSSLIVREGVVVSGRTTLNVPEAEASCEVRVDPVSETGQPVECNAGELLLRHEASGAMVGALGLDRASIHLSPMSSAYVYEWTRRSAPINGASYQFSGALHGISAGRVLSNAPGDLERLHYDFDLSAFDSLAITTCYSTWFGGFGNGYLTICTIDPTVPPAPPGYFENLWTMPLPSHGFSMFASNKMAYKVTNNWFEYSDLRLRSSNLVVESGQPYRGFGRFDMQWQDPLFLQTSGNLRLWAGPPVWCGAFTDYGGSMDLRAAIDLDGRLFRTELGDRILQPDPSYRLYRNNAAVDSGSFAGAGALDAYVLPMFQTPPGSYRLEVRPPAYDLRGRPGAALAEATFAVGSHEAAPPTLIALNVLADGAVTDSVDFRAASSGLVRFRVSDDQGLDSAGLSYRLDPRSSWIALPVTRDSLEFTASLPHTLDGELSLRVEALDAAGNRLRYDLEPAAVVVAGQTVQLALESASAVPDRARLVWRVESGTATLARVDRREGTGPWAELAAVSANAGRFSFEDATVVAGHRYGYRLAIPGSGQTTYSGEVWLDIPAGSELVLRGARPNPTPGQLVVSFTLPAAIPARLEVFDALGRQVRSREVGSLGAGTHVVDLAAGSPLRPGLYVVRLTQGAGTRKTKVSVVP